MAKAKKPKSWTYYKSAKITYPDGRVDSYITQLYVIGVYIIWNNDPSCQGSLEPVDMSKMNKKIQKDVDAGEITCEFGFPITVIENEEGFVELKD